MKAHPAEVPPLPSHPVGRYTDPAFFQLEKDYLCNRVWLLAAVANELPEPGSFKTAEINGRPVVVVRGRDGQIRAFHSACQHRGACLVRDRSGQAASFTCPYHAWNYGLDGALAFLPEESLPKVVRRIFHRYKRHKNILINLVNEVPELRATAENYSVDRLIYRASLIYLQIYQDDFGGKDLRLVHGIMNLVYSSAIKTYLSDAKPSFDEDVFLDQLSTMMLGYLAYDERRKIASTAD